MPLLGLMMSDASKAAFGGNTILPVLSSQKIPTVAPVMTSPFYLDSSSVFFLHRMVMLSFIITFSV